MRPYSPDLRQRILDTVARGEGSLRRIAQRFLVNVSTVVHLLKRYRQTGSAEPKPHAGGRRSALGPDDLERLRELIRQQPDATLDELRDRLGVGCSRMAISRTLKKLRITRKKKVLHADRTRHAQGPSPTTGVPQAGGEDRAGAPGFRGRNRGEHGDDADPRPRPEGERVPGAVPGFWTTLTLICGLRLSGVSAPFVFPGATDTATFETYVGQALAPQLHPGDVVIWDNLAPHKAQSVVKAVERAGAK